MEMFSKLIILELCFLCFYSIMFFSESLLFVNDNLIRRSFFFCVKKERMLSRWNGMVGCDAIKVFLKEYF